MSIEVTVAASTYDLTTLARVKTELGITGSGSDAILALMITEASDHLSGIAERVFAQERVEELVPAFGGTWLTLSRAPIKTLHSVAFDNEPITDATIEDADAGMLYRKNGWLWTAGWRQDIEMSPVSRSEEPRFLVDYTAGYSLPGFSPATTPLLPADVERFAIEWVRATYLAQQENRDPNLHGERIGDWAATYAGAKEATTRLSQMESAFKARWRRPV